MKPPRQIDILGKQWEVIVEKLPEDLNALGLCKHTWSRIFVTTDQSPEAFRDSLLHEIVHALDFELDTRMGERRVRLLATGLLQVLRDNKALVAFLTDGKPAAK